MLARMMGRALDGRDRERIDEIAIADAGGGFDAFGLHRDWVGGGLAVAGLLYEHWFRVSSHGAWNVPKSGPAILAANHSGTLPFDALMLWVDVLRRTDPPRIARPVMDDFVPRLPLVGTLFARGGAVGGSRANLHALLDAGELLMVFPEGTPGIGKPFSARYELQRWRVGHAELAIRHRAPVVPVAIVGAEEQMPQIARIPLRLFGAPYLPVPATPLPLPVHYHIHYGRPLRLHEGRRPEDADDPGVVLEAAEEVAAVVQAMLQRGRAERPGIFR